MQIVDATPGMMEPSSTPANTNRCMYTMHAYRVKPRLKVGRRPLGLSRLLLGLRVRVMVLLFWLLTWALLSLVVAWHID